MARKIRVQEYVKMSGKKYLSAAGYDDIKSAYRNMRARVMARLTDYNYHDAATDTIKNDAKIEQDGDTKITIVQGRSIREFTLVYSNDRKPIPFGHLLKKKADTNDDKPAN